MFFEFIFHSFYYVWNNYSFNLTFILMMYWLSRLLISATVYVGPWTCFMNLLLHFNWPLSTSLPLYLLLFDRRHLHFFLPLYLFFSPLHSFSIYLSLNLSILLLIIPSLLSSFFSPLILSASLSISHSLSPHLFLPTPLSLPLSLSLSRSTGGKFGTANKSWWRGSCRWS